MIVHSLALALGARPVLGINLEAGNQALAASEAHALVSGLGGPRIEALEVGNEPEDYALRWYVAPDGSWVPGRPYGYNPTQYRVGRLRRRLGNVRLAGPATGSP